MKSLKFNAELVPLVLSGEKTSTWRMFDDKDLSVGDELSLIDRSTGMEFAHARITTVIEKKLGDVTNDDFDGHESYESREAMLAAFRSFYGDAVTWETPLKLIQFDILQD